jgi:hypothetical protein
MPPLVLSASALDLFKRCRKAYQLGYEMNLDPIFTNEAVEQGSTFHALMAQMASQTGESLKLDTTDPLSMDSVVSSYIRHRWDIDSYEIISAEKPMYTPLIEGVVLRTTFDLVYRKGQEVFIRDYKTFAAAPTYDVDLDFQGRIYIAAMMKQLKSDRVRFEYEYVRRTPPNVPKDKAGKHWTPDECYINVPLIISKREAAALWHETQWVAADLLRAREEGRWYRQDRKGWNGCQSCFYKDLCKAEVQLGVLDDATINMLSKPREPMEMPNDLPA